MAKHHHIQIEKLRKQNQLLLETVAFYADETKWPPDKGQRAKEILKCFTSSEQQPQQPQ